VERGPEEIIKNLFDSIDIIMKRNVGKESQVEGIGISCGGPLHRRKGLILSPPNLPGWDEIPIVEELQKKFGKPTTLENDANACAIAEWKFGAGKGCRNIIFLTFGTGMGAGLILNGKLYTGANDMAGEVGHVRLAEKGPVGHGKAGSFEGFCGGSGIALLAQQEISGRIERGERVDFCPTLEKARYIAAKDVGLAASSGDSVAIEILKTVGIQLGKGLSILLDIINPEKIIMGSIFVRCEEFLLPYAKAVIQKEALTISYRNCELVPAAFGEKVGDVGCLCTAMSKSMGWII
jgi:glucokinase